MSTSEDAKTNEPKIDEETGLPEGLDPGTSYMDKSPEEKSEPIPSTFGSRLVGKNEDEVKEILAAEKKERDEALKAEEEAQKKAEAAESKSTSSSKS